MAIKVCIWITAIVMLLALAAGGSANGAEPTKCQNSCAATAKLRTAQCNDVSECLDYVAYEYRSCIRACDTKGSR